MMGNVFKKDQKHSCSWNKEQIGAACVGIWMCRELQVEEAQGHVKNDLQIYQVSSTAFFFTLPRRQLCLS